jgi:hypothetical protein
MWSELLLHEHIQGDVEWALAMEIMHLHPAERNAMADKIHLGKSDDQVMTDPIVI